jgi:hypothetical protein
MAYFHSPQIVKDGLVLLLDAANTKSYPGSGTTWFDRSGNGNNGTLVNGPTFDSGNGGSIVFDGVNDDIDLGNSAATQFPHTSPWTASLIGKIISQNTSFPGFLIKGSSGAGGSGVLFFYTGANTLFIKHNNIQPSVSISSTSPFFVSWVHNGDGSTLIYVNGNYITAGPTLSLTDTTNSLRLGRGDAYGNVAIYNFSKYNRALTASEILQNYNAIKGRFGL